MLVILASFLLLLLLQASSGCYSISHERIILKDLYDLAIFHSPYVVTHDR